jgi:hypothetical protein
LTPKHMINNEYSNAWSNLIDRIRARDKWRA